MIVIQCVNVLRRRTVKLRSPGPGYVKLRVATGTEGVVTAMQGALIKPLSDLGRQ